MPQQHSQRNNRRSNPSRHTIKYFERRSNIGKGPVRPRRRPHQKLRVASSASEQHTNARRAGRWNLHRRHGRRHSQHLHQLALPRQYPLCPRQRRASGKLDAGSLHRPFASDQMLSAGAEAARSAFPRRHPGCGRVARVHGQRARGDDARADDAEDQASLCAATRGLESEALVRTSLRSLWRLAALEQGRSSSVFVGDWGGFEERRGGWSGRCGCEVSLSRT